MAGWVGTATGNKKVKNGWVGTTNGNKKVKNGWVGTASGNRIVYSAFPPVYRGNLADYPFAVSGATGLSAPEHALFAGGSTGSSSYASQVYAYNSSLVRSQPASMNDSGYALGKGVVGNYGIFFGAYRSNSDYTNSYYYSAYAYDTSLARTVITNAAWQAHYIGSARNANYAIFAGGYYGGSNRPNIAAFGTNLARTTPTALLVSGSTIGSGRAGQYGIFMSRSVSGTEAGATSTFDAYDANNVRSTVYGAGSSAYDSYCGTIGNSRYAFCGGGRNGYNNVLRTAYVFDANLTRISVADTDTWGSYHETAQVYELASNVVIVPLSQHTTTMDVYDENLVRTNMANFQNNTGINSLGSQGMASIKGSTVINVGGSNLSGALIATVKYYE